MPIYSNSGSLSTYTWATKPSASSMSGRSIIISDVGVNGSVWFSNGTKWVHESPIIHQSDSSGWINPSLAAANAATYSQTGTTITVTSTGHAIPATAHNGKMVFLNIATGAALAGWYSNFQQTGADTFTCVSSVSQSTNGVINTNTALRQFPLDKTIPGGVIGPNGSIRIEIVERWTNSVNNKSIQAKIGGSNYFSLNNTTNVAATIFRSLRNKNSESAQIMGAGLISLTIGGVSGSSVELSIDTSVDFTHTMSSTLAAANEFQAIESIQIELLPA